MTSVRTDDEAAIAYGRAAQEALAALATKLHDPRIADDEISLLVGTAVLAKARELNPGPPEGFHIVRLELSEREFQRMTKDWIFTGAGTRSAGLRIHLGMTERPYGIIKAERERS